MLRRKTRALRAASVRASNLGGTHLLYTAYELSHAAVSPMRRLASLTRDYYRWPSNPMAYLPVGRTIAAACDVFHSTTKRYGKPEWGFDHVMIDGQPVKVSIDVRAVRPFCRLLHFRRDADAMPRKRPDPRVLIVAPMSGHYATLLRGTVKAMLPEHDVYVTDWTDARMVPLAEGGFDLDDFIDYIADFIRLLGPDLHVMGVCQPGPAVLAATALLAADDDPCQPASIVLMGSPIDTRKSPTVPNQLATSRELDWFERKVIMSVPWPHPGFLRRVYPGFLQLTGFMTMNLDRHIDAHVRLFRGLVDGDGDSTQAHRRFYDEYLAVMDMTAEFYLQTIKVVFQDHDLPDGRMRHRGGLVEPAAIRKTGLMTVEGERDDISGIGQTQAAHDICTGIPAEKRVDYVQPGVGHYGVFNGARWRTEIQPRVRDFIRSNPTLGAMPRGVARAAE